MIISLAAHYANQFWNTGNLRWQKLLGRSVQPLHSYPSSPTQESFQCLTHVVGYTKHMKLIRPLYMYIFTEHISKMCHIYGMFTLITDTGGGNALNVQRTIKALIAAGAAGCFLEVFTYNFVRSFL